MGRNKRPADEVIREFLAGLLYTLLVEILGEMKRKGIEIYGDLDFRVVERIDGRRRRVAKLEGNRILVKINAILFPRRVIEYIVAHEVAHILYKRHTKGFWQFVARLHPDYKECHRFLEDNVRFIERNLLERRVKR
ncbi:M48 family metallopeptidase [bacterium]|nr:M48 family metallopeptidase [bacterium]